MKLTVLTLSTLLAIVFAAPAKVSGTDPLIFWTFKDTTSVTRTSSRALDLPIT